MKLSIRWLFILAVATMTGCTQVQTNAPSVSNPKAGATTNAPSINAASTNDVSLGTNDFSNKTQKELEEMVIRPPTSPTGIPTMPTMIDREPPPPLSAEAQRHEYIGFRLGMSPQEAALVAQTAGKKLEEVQEGRRYQMDGCLTVVPQPDKAKTLLTFKEGKLDLIKLYWDDNNTLFVNLETNLPSKYGKPLSADELFRRFWILANDDCIRLLYDIATHQTSLLYGSKKSVFDLNEWEKGNAPKEYRGL